MKKSLIVSLLLSLFAVASYAEEQSSAIEGGACADEATLSDIRASKPFICANGHWRKVIFKTDADGVTSPLFYEGKCAWRFTEGSTTTARLTVNRSELVDICLPTGWRVHMVASDESISWMYHSSPSIPNVLLVQAIGPGHRATLWVYPATSEGMAPQKLDVQLQLRSVK